MEELLLEATKDGERCGWTGGVNSGWWRNSIRRVVW
jgi:hypothetical protein